MYYINTLVHGGAETVVSDIAINIKNNNHEVCVIALYPVNSFITTKLIKSGISVRYIYQHKPRNKLSRILREILSPLNIKKGFRKYIKSFNPDIIHINTNAKYSDLIDFPSNRIVYTFHSEVKRMLEIGGIRNKRNIAKLSRQGCFFTALTSGMENDLINTYHTNRVQIIPNGVDIAFIKEKAYKKINLIKELSIPEDSFIIGHVGRFHPVKNHRRLITIFNTIYEKNKKAHLVLVGDGSSSEKAAIEDQINNLNLSERVHMLGIRPDANLIMGAFDAFVMPSLSESFAIALVEAQVHGIRCVASSVIHKEIFCNPNCFSMNLSDGDEVWADKVLGNDIGNSNNNLLDFDVHSTVDKLIAFYMYILKEGKQYEN